MSLSLSFGFSYLLHLKHHTSLENAIFSPVLAPGNSKKKCCYALHMDKLQGVDVMCLSCIRLRDSFHYHSPPSCPHTASGCCPPVQLSGESGNFSSVNYPDNYNNGMNSIWVITVDPDKVTASLHCNCSIISLLLYQGCHRQREITFLLHQSRSK